jgi:hypothetical protein
MGLKYPWHEVADISEAARREGYIAGQKDEREACADIVESWKNGQRTRDDLIDRMLDEIRARKETTS